MLPTMMAALFLAANVVEPPHRIDPGRAIIQFDCFGHRCKLECQNRHDYPLYVVDIYHRRGVWIVTANDTGNERWWNINEELPCTEMTHG
jgi:hypothetical protein